MILAFLPGLAVDADGLLGHALGRLDDYRTVGSRAEPQVRMTSVIK